MSKKVFRVSDESLNSFGFWVLSEGGDLGDFNKNSIMLYNHDRRELPIGTWEGMTLKDGSWLCSPKFTTHQRAKDIMDMVEDGTIKTASIGFIPLETSKDPKYIKQGQLRETVTKWKLVEISLTDIPSNKNAVVLYDTEMNIINLSDGGDCKLPLLTELKENDTSFSKNNKVEMKELLVKLNLPETATEAEAIVKLQDVQSEVVTLKSENAQLKAEKATARKGDIKTLLDAAVTEKRIQETDRPEFEQLFDKDFGLAKSMLAKMQPQVKLSEVIVTGSAGGTTELKWNGEDWKQLDKAGKLETLKAQNLDLFKQMFKAEYGREYKA